MRTAACLAIAGLLGPAITIAQEPGPTAAWMQEVDAASRKVGDRVVILLRSCDANLSSPSFCVRGLMGKLLATGPDTLVILPDSGETQQTIPLQWVERMRVWRAVAVGRQLGTTATIASQTLEEPRARGHAALQGLELGAMVGGLAGAFGSSALCSSLDVGWGGGGCDHLAALLAGGGAGAVIGGLLGAGIGALIPTDYRISVPVPSGAASYHVTVVPSWSHARSAVAIRVAFRPGR